MTLPEFERTRLLQRLLAPGDASALVVPNGDDAAVLRIPGNLVVTTDALVEGVDFLGWAPWHSAGHKALAVNLSDLAAMGAEPVGYLNALCLPRTFSDENLEDLARGMAGLGVGCVGGDFSRIDGPVVITITALGTVGPGQALTRRGARAGDGVYVSGMVGAAAAGLKVLMDAQPVTNDDVRCAVEAQLRPTPRLALGRALRGVATACIDVSDGLLQDLSHLLVASDVGAVLVKEDLPIHPAAFQVGGNAWTLALAGGEDFELLFTAADHAAVLAAAAAAQVKVSRLGQVTADGGLSLQGMVELTRDDVTAMDRGYPVAALSAAGMAGFRHF